MTEQGAMVALIIVNWEYSEPRQLEPLLYTAGGAGGAGGGGDGDGGDGGDPRACLTSVSSITHRGLVRAVLVITAA